MLLAIQGSGAAMTSYQHPSGLADVSQRHGAHTRWSKALCLGVLAGSLLIASFGPGVPSAVAASTSMVDLGQASTYAVLSGASVGNTVSAPSAPYTTLRGDLGVDASAQPTGFPPGVVTGTVNVGNAAATQAHADLVTAYNEVAARTGGTALAGALAGKTISPGLYTVAGAVSNTGTVTLNGGGDPNAVFVFQVDGAMALAAGSDVVLTNGAQASRVFWQVHGAGAVGANADFAGTLMALNAVAVGNGSVVNGRAFALNGALTLDADEFYSAPPVVTIVGGATTITNDPTPTISGTTDVDPPGVVTVTVAGQTLTATPSDGTWSVNPEILANGTYPVLASTIDGAGNPGDATQQLTIDTVPPVVTLDGGPSVITNDPTPTIAGTSDVAPGTIIHVAVSSQTLTALVQSGETWNVTPSALSDGTHTVTASVADPAGNEGTDSQVLTIDTIAPAVTITGGPNALTNDPTPDISGTADVAPGTTVIVILADQTLTGLVGANGAWSVTAATLADGPHRVIMSVSDAAGNLASVTQWLTVDTVPPIATITGGATATTSDLDPTITGTSNAAPGTTVTVSIAGQTMTTLLQTTGTWNATPSPVGAGTWTIVASVPDPAGNVGSATQTLTIATNPPSTPANPPSSPVSPPPSPARPPVEPHPPPPVTAGPPSITALAESAPVWREANTLEKPSKGKPPIGTIFSFMLNEQDTVTLTFTHTTRGRSVHGRCINQTAKNKHNPPCSRTTVAGRLKLTGHPHANRVHFYGGLSHTNALKPGRYTLTITTTNAAGRHATSRSLSFRIVR
jgi:Ice-binding-like/Bacterial Ig-like domain